MTTAPTAPVVDELTRARVQRRTLGVLWSSAVFSRGGFSAMFPVAVLAMGDLLDDETWAGTASAASTVGAAVSAAAIAGFMSRRGRRPGLTAGFGMAIFGALFGALAIELGLLALFLGAMVLVGVGMGTANLARYVAADLALPDRRARDISTVIFASTFGAVFFPLLIGPAGAIAEDAGLDENIGGFGMGVILFVLAAGVCAIFLRPDPLVVSGGITEASDTSKRVTFPTAARIAWNVPMARIAFLTLVLSQAVMVMVMTMTPLHMDAHGHGTGVVGQVISAHTAGMFAFAPVAGWLSDRAGRLPTIVLGGGILVLATAMTALAGEAPKLLMFPGLFLLGLGWSFGIVAGSALLTESVAEHERVAVQGAADTATNMASGIGALSSGVVLSMAGFHILSMMGMVAAGVVLVLAFFRLRIQAASAATASSGAT